MATKENIKVPPAVQKLMIAYGYDTAYFVTNQCFFDKNSAETIAAQNQTKIKEVKIKN